MFISIFSLIGIIKLFLFHVHIDDRGVPNVGVVGIELALARVALSAEGHVHILAPDHILIVFAGRAERVTRVLLAELADGGEFLDLFALGNQGQNVWEGAPEEGPLQARDHDNLAIVRSLLRKLDYIGKELALVNADNVEIFPLVAQLGQSIDGCSWHLLA